MSKEIIEKLAKMNFSFPYNNVIEIMALKSLDKHGVYSKDWDRLYWFYDIEERIIHLKDFYQKVKNLEGYNFKLMSKLLLALIKFHKNYLLDVSKGIKSENFTLTFNFDWKNIAIKYGDEIMLFKEGKFNGVLKLTKNLFEELYSDMEALKEKNVFLLSGFREYEKVKKEVFDAFIIYKNLKQ